MFRAERKGSDLGGVLAPLRARSTLALTLPSLSIRILILRGQHNPVYSLADTLAHALNPAPRALCAAVTAVAAGRHTPHPRISTLADRAKRPSAGRSS